MYHLNTGNGGGHVDPSGESKWFLGKTNGPREEQMGDTIVCYKVCLGMVCDKSLFFLVDEIPREGIYDNGVPFWRICF